MIKVVIAQNEKEAREISVAYRETTVGALLADLELSASRFGGILLNGKPAKESDRLADGDVVYLLPRLSGG